MTTSGVRLQGSPESRRSKKRRPRAKATYCRRSTCRAGGRASRNMLTPPPQSAAPRRAPTCLFRIYNIITLSTSHLYADKIILSLTRMEWLPCDRNISQMRITTSPAFPCQKLQRTARIVSEPRSRCLFWSWPCLGRPFGSWSTLEYVTEPQCEGPSTICMALACRWRSRPQHH
jgi:hypothetical protein